MPRETCENCGKIIYDGECGCLYVRDYHFSEEREEWQPQKEDWGVEIELEPSNKREILKTCKAEGWLVELDASLNDNGVEIISPPMPYNNLVQSIKKIIPKICGWGWDCGIHYGLHINFNGEQITTRNLCRFVEFVSSNPLKLCEFISGRRENRFAQYGDKKGKEESYVLCSYTKYEAVNLSSYPRVEVRIFRSTLKVESIIANMEFVKSIMSFVNTENFDSLFYRGTEHEIVQKYIEHARQYEYLTKKMIDFTESRNGALYEELKNIILLNLTTTV